jgi:hypothetical protein
MSKPRDTNTSTSATSTPGPDGPTLARAAVDTLHGRWLTTLVRTSDDIRRATREMDQELAAAERAFRTSPELDANLADLDAKIVTARAERAAADDALKAADAVRLDPKVDPREGAGAFMAAEAVADRAVNACRATEEARTTTVATIAALRVAPFKHPATYSRTEQLSMFRERHQALATEMAAVTEEAIATVGAAQWAATTRIDTARVVKGDAREGALHRAMEQAFDSMSLSGEFLSDRDTREAQADALAGGVYEEWLDMARRRRDSAKNAQQHDALRNRVAKHEAKLAEIEAEAARRADRNMGHVTEEVAKKRHSLKEARAALAAFEAETGMRSEAVAA